ncbi:hypothetical protein ACF0H5_007385 [Mactra antiquata]
MAFLCPSRLGRKQKKGFQSMLNKLTENNSIDSIALRDLVKLSWTTPESRRIVLQNFTAYAQHEITVKQGQKVRYIYREGDWAYIVTNDKKEGFVPFNCIAKLGVPNKPNDRVVNTGTYTKKTIDIRQVSVGSEEADFSVSDNADDSFVSSDWSFDSTTETGSLVHDQEHNNLSQKQGTKNTNSYETNNDMDDDVPPSPLAQYKVINDYKGRDEIEVSVKADDVVHLLNTSDPNWYWVRTSEGVEGYMPSYYITEITNGESTHNQNNTKHDKNGPQGDDYYEGKGNHIDIEYEYDSSHAHYEDESSVFSDDLSDRATFSDIQPKQKKKHPKKPPRKNRPKSASQDLNESVDSLESMLTDCTMNVVNDSVFDESFYTDSIDDGKRNNNNTTNDDDDTDSCMETVSLGPISSGLPYRDMIGLHLKPPSISQRHLHHYSRSGRHSSSSRHVHNESHNIKSSQNRQSGEYSSRSRNRADRDSSKQIRTSQGRKNRPVSMPTFNSFQESGNGYFDEYFYEDNDSNFKNSDKHDIVNVSEILKLRMAKEAAMQDKFSQKRNQNERNKDENRKRRELPNIKPFLLNLSDGNTEHLPTKTNTSNKNNDKVHVDKVEKHGQHSHSPKRDRNNDSLLEKHNQMNGDTKRKHKEHKNETLSTRKFHSSTDLRLIGNSNSEDNETNKGVVSKDKKSPANNKYGFKHVLKQYNSSIDLSKNIDSSEVIHKNTIEAIKQTHGKETNTRSPGHNRKRKRPYKSSSENRTADVFHQSDATNYSHKQSLNQENMMTNHKSEKGHVNARKYNSSTDLRHINGPADWSFGYPRKSRHSSGETQTVTNSKSDHHEHSNKSDVMPLHVKNEIPEKRNNDWNIKVKTEECKRNHYKEALDDNNEDDMMQLLSQTENLLNVSDTLLDDDSDNSTVDNLIHDSQDDANKEANDKCNQFLTNSTIGINGMTSYPKQNDKEIYLKSNENDTSKNGNPENEVKVKVKLKSIEVQTDMNEDVCSNCPTCSNKKKAGQSNNLLFNDVRGITEFVSQCHYEPEGDNMLPMKLGEIVHVGLDSQTRDEWYWAFSPRLRQYGFIPKQHVKIPMVTII